MRNVEEIEDAGKVVGRNVRRIRTGAGATMEQLARTGRQNGSRWSLSRIAEIERGASNPRFEVLVELAHALGQLTGEPVALADLFESDGYVELTGSLPVRAAHLQSLLRGAPVEFGVGDLADHDGIQTDLQHETNPTLTDWVRRAGWRDVEVAQEELGVSRDKLARVLGVLDTFEQVDQRTAKQLGTDPAVLARLCLELWGHSLGDEREKRAGESATRQQLAQVTTKLRAELRAAADQLTERQKRPGAAR